MKSLSVCVVLLFLLAPGQAQELPKVLSQPLATTLLLGPGGLAQGSPPGKTLSQPMIVDGKPEFLSRPITVECRARLTNPQKFNTLIACNPKSSSEHWSLFSLKGTGMFSVYQPGRGNTFVSGKNICDGWWHHLAAYLGQDVVKLYVDGVKVLEAPAPQRNNAPAPGELAFLSLVEGGLECDGEMDEVRISRGERRIVSDNKPFVADGGTLGMWDFDNIVTAVPAPTPVNRESLPEFHTIPAATAGELTPANGWPAAQSFRDWHRSLGGPTSNRFSALDQINRSNVKTLETAWTYHSNDGTRNIQCNPIIVDGVIYLPTPGGSIAAVNGETGEEIWRISLKGDGVMSMEGVPARRGLLYWPGDSKDQARLIVGRGNGIFAIDPKKGELIPTFGQNGCADLPTGATVAGAVYQDILVMPGYARDVFGYDIRTGKQLWRFNTMPAAGQVGFESWRGRERSGANCWGGMALDESRGIAYVATGSPKGNFIGVNHLGDNLFSDCVIALDVKTGKRLWHFQEIRHDIWDMDIPAPPNLVTVTRDGRRVDAVAQVTKYGNTLLLDRVTGKPLFPFRLRKAPASKLPGEETAVYQPYLELPEPFARQEFSREDITDRTPEARAFIENALANANMGWFEPFELDKPTVFFGILGGAEWTGAAVDASRLYVSANHIPWAITVVRDAQGAPAPSEFSAANPPPPGVAAGEQTYKQFCMVCHGPNLEGKGMVPPLKTVASRFKKEEVIGITKNGKNAMPPLPMLTDQQRDEVAQFLFARGSQMNSNPGGPLRFSFTGYNKLNDQQGYPGNKPPWGTLDCIDLNTGKKVWSVPLGEYPELTAAGIRKTGTENFGGPMVTAGGLVFCSGTRDKKIRAFDSATGEELWSADLPLHGTAPPASYEVNGRQYIILPATGGGKLGGPTGDAWVAFALPKSR